jgi:ABC-type amino acid transport substrate-binding protein
MVDPFVSYTGDKGFDGYAYKLLLLMFPDEEFEFIRMDNIEDAIEKTKNGEVAFTIGAFSKTAEREEYLDFSHSFYQSKPAVAVRKRNTWVDNALWIAQRLGGGIVIFIAMLYVVGFLVNKGDGDSKIKTTHQGAWWALVTFSTVGYGDLVPDTAKGKFLASIWIIASLFLIATFTGYMSSAMTVKKLTEQPTNLNYLATSKLATVEGSTSENLLTALNFNYQPFGYVEDALLELINGRVNAIIYDKPMLEYHLRGNENYDVWEIPSAPNEHYAFIFPEGSEMLETVNREMLRVLPSVEWQRIHNSYFK